MVGIKHKKTNTVPPWTQADLDAQIAAGNVPTGTLLSGFVLSTDWNDDHTSGNAAAGTLLTADGSGGMSFLAQTALSTGTVSAGSNITITGNGTTASPYVINGTGGGGSGTPGGSDTNVQFNDGGTFGGDPAFAWNKTTKKLTVKNDLVIGSATPSTWTYYNGVFDGGTNAVIYGASGDFHIASNAVGLGAWTYYGNGPAANMYIYNGELHYRTAPSGGAGAGISWTDAFSSDINGNFYVRSKIGIGKTASSVLDISYYGSSGQGLNVMNTNAGGFAEIRLINDSNQVAQFFKTGTSYTPYKTIGVKDFGFYNDTNGGNLSFLNDSGNINWTAGGASTAHMTLSTAGYLGIGTNTPVQLLDVNGSIHIAQNNSLMNSSNQYFRFNSDNTFTAFGDYFSVNGQGFGACMSVQNRTAGGYSGIEYLNESGTIQVFTGYRNDGSGEFRFNNVASNGYIAFKIASTDKLRIENNGNITVSNNLVLSNVNTGIYFAGGAATIFCPNPGYNDLQFTQNGGLNGNLNRARGWSSDGGGNFMVDGTAYTTTSTYDLGKSANPWRNLYLSGSIAIGTVSALTPLDVSRSYAGISYDAFTLRNMGAGSGSGVNQNFVVAGNSATTGQISHVYNGTLYDTFISNYASGGLAVALKINGNTNNSINIASLATGGTAPTTSGTVNMVITDVNGQLSRQAIPTGGNTTYVNTTKVDQTPASSPYGTLSGTVNGTNAVFTVSNGAYVTGTLTVYLNGQLQQIGTDFTETSPSAGTFTFAIAPPTGSTVLADYITQATSTSSGTTIGLISTTGAIDGKTVANTALYTVPTGKTLLMTGYVVRCTAATSITNGPAAGLGYPAGTNNVTSSQAMNALVTTADTFSWAISGMSKSVPAGTTLYFNLGTAATGTSQTLAVDVIGYLL